MTLDVVAGGYKRQLQTLAAAWRDVSWFTWIYDRITSQSDTIKSQLGMDTSRSVNTSTWSTSIGWGFVYDVNNLSNFWIMQMPALF
jgi:hypothetical protein